LVILDPTSFNFHNKNPIFIEDVHLDNEPIDTNNLQLLFGSGDIKVKFTTPQFQYPENIIF